MPRCIKLADLPNAAREGRASSMLYGPALLKNAVFSIAASLFRVPITVAAAGTEAVVRGAERVALGQAPAQQTFMGEAAAHLYGFFHALPLALRKFGRDTKTTRDIMLGSALGEIAERAPGTAEAAVLGAAGKVLQVPFKVLSWTDDYFFNFNYASQMFRFAYRRARQEGFKTFESAMGRANAIIQEQAQEAGALSQRVTTEVTKRMTKGGTIAVDPKLLQKEIGYALRSATPESLADPRTLAERTIFIAREKHSLDKILDVLEETDKKTGYAVSLLAPFRRTPANEAREFLRATPLGFATAAVKYQRAKAAGVPIHLARQYAFEDTGQAIVGTMALASIALALKGGMIKVTPFYTGKSKALRATEEAANEAQESITIGKYNIPVRNLGTLGQAILSTEKAVREFDQWRAANPTGTTYPERVGFWARQSTLGVLLGVADQQFLQNLTELHEAWKNPDKSLPLFAQRFGASFVPGFVRAAARAGEPVVPVPEEEAKQGLLQNIAAGARQAVAPKGVAKLGLFGEPVTRAGGVVGALTGTREVSDDPLVRKMLEVGALHTAPATDINIPLKGGKKVKLSELYPPEDQVIFGQAKGALQRHYMQSQLRASGFSRLSPEAQKRVLDAAFERAGRVIDGRMRQFALQRRKPNYRDLLRGLIPA